MRSEDPGHPVVLFLDRYKTEPIKPNETLTEGRQNSTEDSIETAQNETGQSWMADFAPVPHSDELSQTLQLSDT